jgi:hypothetical protein
MRGIVNRDEFKNDGTSEIAGGVRRRLLLPSDASHFSEILDVSFADLFEEMKFLAVLGMISDCLVASGVFHVP